jgi:hypothetical protein
MFFEKEWGGNSGAVYRDKILPWVYRFMDWVKNHPQNQSKYAILMEDNAA